MAYIGNIKKQKRANLWSRGDRAVFGGGYYPSAPGGTNVIQYFSIASTGDAVDFGDLRRALGSNGSYGNTTRGIFAGGKIPAPAAHDEDDEIQYVTIASTGNAAVFGDLTSTIRGCGGGAGSDTRGFPVMGGYTAPAQLKNIDYITMSSTGNGIDFGDLSVAKTSGASFSSPTRAFAFGGNLKPDTKQDVIDHLTIATTGDAVDFGNLHAAIELGGSAGSDTRGISAGGGLQPDTKINVIDYITMASLGDASDFGDLIAASYSMNSSNSGNISRGIFGGGGYPYTDVIQYITIASTGNATDFGDLLTILNNSGGCSNSHGGLSDAYAVSLNTV